MNMKRTINTIALLIALLMLAMVFSQAALAEGSYVRTAGNVNVRSGAGTEYRVLGTAAKNSELTARINEALSAISKEERLQIMEAALAAQPSAE